MAELGDLNIEGLAWSWTILGLIIMCLTGWIGSLLYQAVGYLDRQEQRDRHFYHDWVNDTERQMQNSDQL